MSNVIRYLETIGRNPALSPRRDAGRAETIAALGIEEGQRQALLGNDVQALGRALGGREVMRCLILTPDE